MPSVRRITPAPAAWLLPAGTLGFLCGILLGRAVDSPAPALASLALSVTAALLSRQWRRILALMLAAFSAGTLLGWHGYHPDLPLEGAYTVEATVVQEFYVEADGQVRTLLSGVTLDGQNAPDAHWTFYMEEGESLPDWLTPGVHVSFTGEVYHPAGQMNPGGFNFREYLLQRGVKIGLYGSEALTATDAPFSLRGWFAALRHDLILRLHAVMGEEAGAYAAAMLLGSQDFIPADERAAFQKLGIAHILSVSGFHVGVLIALMLLLMRPLPLGRGGRMVFEAVILAFYCMLTGGNAPVIRAAGLLLWREFIRMRHRQILPLHMLCVTALAQLIFNPTLLTGASFQLTYCAMLGLLLVYPRLKARRVWPTVRLGKLWDAFAASLSAQLGLLFPQLYWFGELPLFSILLNMAVVPLFTGLMLLYWATLASLPVPGLRDLLGLLSAGATHVLLEAVRFLASLDLATLWTRQADFLTFAGWLLMLLSLSVLLPRRLERRRKALLLCGVVLMSTLLIPLPEQDTAYIQFSVGNADAALLQDQDMTVAIDVGEDGEALAGYLHRRRQGIDLLIITHLHTDHAGGIHALLEQEIPVAVCCLPAEASVPVIDEETLPLLEALRQTGTDIRYLSRGDVIDLPSGQLTVLWPEAGRISSLHDANDTNLVLHADIAGVTMLLTGDLPVDFASYISLPADILKAAHHGSKGANTAESLALVAPRVILQSNRLESREVHMAEIAGEIPLYTTDQDGGIVIRFLGGGRFEVETGEEQD